MRETFRDMQLGKLLAPNSSRAPTCSSRSKQRRTARTGPPEPRGRGAAEPSQPRRDDAPCPRPRRELDVTREVVGTTASVPPASDWAPPPRLPPPPAAATAAACLLRLGVAPSPTTSSSRRCLHLPPACSDWAPHPPVTRRRPRCVGPALAPRPPLPPARSHLRPRPPRPRLALARQPPPPLFTEGRG